MAFETPYRTITGLLRGLNAIVPRIAWGSTASPYYKKAPEPPPDFVYVVYDMALTTIEHTQDQGPGESYNEKRVLSLSVYGTTDEVELAAAPEVDGSLFNYLDSLANAPGFLSGIGFTCTQFLRNGYELALSEQRDENSISWVWCAKTSYDYWTTVPRPLLKI